MISRSPLTLQDIIDFANEHHIPYDIPVGIALCDSRHGGIVMGIVVDTPEEACEYDKRKGEYIMTETTGKHCYFKGPIDELRELPLEKQRMLMLTDGTHCE